MYVEGVPTILAKRATKEEVEGGFLTPTIRTHCDHQVFVLSFEKVSSVKPISLSKS
jgi:hypothetical protein